jgi:membrane-bound lytic murein transglycosylase A
LILFREILQSTTDDAEIDRQIRENFLFWDLKRENSSSSILLTGYYEPILEGSLEPEGEYRYPIYQRPDDLVDLPPDGLSPGRVARMEKGRRCPTFPPEDRYGRCVAGKRAGTRLARISWERFVLHIQGSGQIRLPDGDTLRVGYASNGRPYRPIGRYLIDQGFWTKRIYPSSGSGSSSRTTRAGRKKSSIIMKDTFSSVSSPIPRGRMVRLGFH